MSHLKHKVMKTNVILLAIVFLAVTSAAGNPFSGNDTVNVLWAGNFSIPVDFESNNTIPPSNVVLLNFEHYQAIEAESLELEGWMMNEENFGTFFTVEVETEEALELESWMTNEKNFDVYASFFEVETEEALELEDWMTDTNNFGTFIEIEPEEEKPLQVESWMMDTNSWK